MVQAPDNPSHPPENTCHTLKKQGIAAGRPPAFIGRRYDL